MEHPSYEEGRLAAIAVRLAMSSGLPPANARAALELACHMIDDAMTQKSEPCLPSAIRGHTFGLGGGRNRDVSGSKHL
ncbi:MAG: hypothetical protein JO067_15290 [Cupriavidus sp.]|nr:hypothetical protein [Cupriavidus sp.]